MKVYNIYYNSLLNNIEKTFQKSLIDTIEQSKFKYSLVDHLEKHKEIIEEIEDYLSLEFRPKIDFKEIKFMNSIPEVQYLVIISFTAQQNTNIINDKLMLIYFNPQPFVLESKISVTQEEIINKIEEKFKILDKDSISIIDIKFEKIKLETDIQNMKNVFSAYNMFFDNISGEEQNCAPAPSSKCEDYRGINEDNFKNELKKINMDSITTEISNIQVFYTFYNVEDDIELNKCSLFLVRHPFLNEEKVLYLTKQDILYYPSINEKNIYTYDIQKTDWGGLEICRFTSKKNLIDTFENPNINSLEFSTTLIGASGYRNKIQNCQNYRHLFYENRLIILSKNNFDQNNNIKKLMGSYQNLIKSSLLDDIKDFSLNFNFQKKTRMYPYKRLFQINFNLVENLDIYLNMWKDILQIYDDDRNLYILSLTLINNNYNFNMNYNSIDNTLTFKNIKDSFLNERICYN